MRILVFTIALVIGGWLVFDGTRALTRGNYVTTRAGKLGPWSRLVSALGLDPRSRLIKWLHVVLGLLWMISAVLFLANGSGGRSALLGCSLLTLWYLPVGTILSVAQIILLCLPALRGSK